MLSAILIAYLLDNVGSLDSAFKRVRVKENNRSWPNSALSSSACSHCTLQSWWSYELDGATQCLPSFGERPLMIWPTSPRWPPWRHHHLLTSVYIDVMYNYPPRIIIALMSESSTNASSNNSTSYLRPFVSCNDQHSTTIIHRNMARVAVTSANAAFVLRMADYYSSNPPWLQWP